MLKELPGKARLQPSLQGKSVVSVTLFTEISMDSGPSCAAFLSFAPDVDHGSTLAQTMNFGLLNRLMLNLNT